MLDMSDAFLAAERQPQALIDLGNKLKKAYGVGADNFGIRGNEFHYSGFHRSRNFLLYSPQGNGGDYSTSGPLNDGDDDDLNCAFDFTPGAWGTQDNRQKMITLTRRLHDAAVAHDSRLDAYYEFAGTLDGSTVVTFYAQGGGFKTPFDSSHLDHIHGSKYRSRANWDDTGLCDILLGANVTEDEDDMGASFGPIEIQKVGGTTLSIPPVGKGYPDGRDNFLNICNDTFGAGQYALKAYWSKGDGNFGELMPPTVFNSGFKVFKPLPQDCCLVSIYRMAIDSTTGKAVDPSDSLKPYGGQLTCCIERGPVLK